MSALGTVARDGIINLKIYCTVHDNILLIFLLSIMAVLKCNFFFNRLCSFYFFLSPVLVVIAFPTLIL